MRRLLLALALLGAVVLAPGCLRIKYDRCAQDPPHPDCLDAATPDAAAADSAAPGDAARD